MEHDLPMPAPFAGIMCMCTDAEAAHEAVLSMQEHASALQRSIEAIKEELSKLLGACAWARLPTGPHQFV